MALKDVWIKKVGANRGRPRIYFDGLQAIRAGFSPGERFNVDVDGQRIVISKNDDGSRAVSARRRQDEDLPVIDINSAELLAVFDGMDAVRVVVGKGKIFLLPLASEMRKVERINRLRTKLIEKQPLAAGSLAHGGGVLTHAIHQGLKDANIECDLTFVNELREDLLLHAMVQNDAWNEDTAALAVPMQELAQDEWLLSRLPKLDLLEMGLPCSGASLAGHTKKGLEKMEDHEEVGHLVYSALVVISKTNPSIVTLENVPRYASTASAMILRHQFRDMGYDTHEALLDGADFGCLEKRVRWVMVAVTKGIEFSFEQLAPHMRVVRTLSDVIDPEITEDDPRWRAVQYLKDKRARNEAEGNGFKMQFVTPDSQTVPTLRKHYYKGGSTDPRLRHPTNPELSRLLTHEEHAGVKDVPIQLVKGLSPTMAHQLLGQGITYDLIRAVGRRIGDRLNSYITPAEIPTDASETTGEREASMASLRRQRAVG
ncbi:MAG: DNA cytosine methyltransferase [Caldisericota bacterium]|nr:DNA cytosine methyltransferase [Caldisericota bacterium]